jgi:hypothetical protein
MRNSHGKFAADLAGRRQPFLKLAEHAPGRNGKKDRHRGAAKSSKGADHRQRQYTQLVEKGAFGSYLLAIST